MRTAGPAGSRVRDTGAVTCSLSKPCRPASPKSGTLSPMEWSIGKQDRGRWPFRVLTSQAYLGLLEVLTRDAIEWRLSTQHSRRRGPGGHPLRRNMWGPDDPITQLDVSSRLATGSTVNFRATYSDNSILYVNLISNSWVALSNSSNSMAHQRPASAANYVRKHARWWPSLSATLLLAVILFIVPFSLLWTMSNGWTFVALLVCSALSYIITWPHQGPAIADRLLPFPVPRIVFGPINLTGAIGALTLVVITALVTKTFTGN